MLIKIMHANSYNRFFNLKIFNKKKLYIIMGYLAIYPIKPYIVSIKSIGGTVFVN